MEGQLLATARPYLQLFSLFTLMPPPSIYERNSDHRRRQLLIFVFGCYTCCVLLLGLYVSYVNTTMLNAEILLLAVGDFTSNMGLLQIVLYTILPAITHVCILIHFGRLARIYVEITALELDIDAASQYFGGQRQRYYLQKHLAIVVGLWLIFLFLALPRTTMSQLGMKWRDNILTELIMLVMQLKSVEYTLFVLLVRELLLRLRHSLIQLKQELTVCEGRALLQALCAALRRNKQLMSRIWRLVGELEVYFMLPMMLLFLYNCFSMLHIVNWVYIQSLNPNDCSNCRFWRVGHLTVLLINLLLPCWISQNCISTYNSFKRIIHSIRCGFYPQLLKNALREYSLQFEHLKLRFTCGGFFDINLSCFGSMVVTMASFTIILIQFKMQGFLSTSKSKAGQQ
ncbi:GH24967 [Drosophila grimshawi]|uniref:Gustatory receptor n=2 Tax=Drosophila grimshawi TaxID=7222 RepID=B4JTD5_DROGR|nr:GH24967 [Drosophila grimshawi]